VVLSGRDALLVYGNRTAQEIVFRDELDVLATASGGRLRVIHVLSNDPSWTGERGRVDRARLSRLVPDIRERDAILCGPPAMMASVTHALKELGMPSPHIHSERFRHLNRLGKNGPYGLTDRLITPLPKSVYIDFRHHTAGSSRRLCGIRARIRTT
jgi:ferredoxin-NADP reductase